MVKSTGRAAARRVRHYLLTSAALLVASTIVHAQTIEERPTGSIQEAQNGTTDPSIIVSPPNTPTTARDPVNVNGVGQMVVDELNGFIGLCTGTLINPRTVIFAAHCVNETPDGTAVMNPWGYGTGPGQLPIAFGFQNNNNVSGNSAFGHWLNGNAGGAKHLTSVSEYLYNVNQVLYNPASVTLGIGNNFLQGDVAIASLDTPAANVPTWSLLLSALPAPSSISTAAGTDYHVTVEGYGTNGVGPTGATGGIDYRRRVAENYVGLLGSLDDLDLFLFGEPDGLPQNLYQLDFDSPGHTNAYDFNVFKDNALPNEGITAPGDSGGPLILDRTFAKQVVIAVLSGGDRFFNDQPSSSYGTSSFYQPLYLFWDYIAANNPYRYVGALAGNGAWTDPAHWVTNLDPAYNVILNGQLVNGLPATLGAGVTGTAGKFGQICFQTGANSDCYDVATGIEYVNGAPVTTSTGTVGAQVSQATKVVEAGTGAVGDSLTSIKEAQDGSASATSLGSGSADGTQTEAALPAATLANGLPGATNFVPNNVDPNAATHINARYFDVTLSATGTTTLSSAATIDRLTITSAGAKLTVASGGSLTSLIGINQLDGLVTNDGVVTTADYLLLSGGIAGAGRFNAPFFTSATGMIAPGTIGGIATLTFGGNLILASGNRLLIDLAANGVSDRVAVVTTAAGTGIANLGGTVGFAPVAGYTIRSGDSYTILTSQAPLTGSFAAPTALSAILTPKFTYTANAVQAQIAAGLYADVVANTPIQRAYAGLLDRNRSNYGSLSELYGILDLQNGATIRGTLEGLAPRAEPLKRAIGTVALDNMSRFYRDRLSTMNVTGGLGGSLSLIGQPTEVASMIANSMPGAPPQASDAPTTTLPGKLPDDMSAFIAGGYLNGRSSSLPGALPGGFHDRFDGYYVAAGIEKAVDDRSALGFGLSYTRQDGTTAAVSQAARGDLYQGTLYGKTEFAGGVTLDSQISAGIFQARTDRSVGVAGTPYRLRSRDNALALTSEVGLGKTFDLAAVTVGPRLALRASHLDFTTTAERGGGPALQFDHSDFESLQGRAGLTLGPGTSSGGTILRPYASAYYVHNFRDTPGTFGANFVGGVGPSALFGLPGQDKEWGEISAGLTYTSDKLELSVGTDTTVWRSDVSNQSYRGAVKIRF